MPGTSGALHLDLFEAASGAGAGFDTSRISSEWGVNESAYVLANFNKTTARPLDVGIGQVSGSGNVTAEAVASTYLATNPSGIYGPFTLGAGRILALHEAQLPAGPILVALNNNSGTVDWGFSIHPADSAYHAKRVASSQTTAWLNGAGLGEAAAITVPVAGRYLVAVWKSRNTDLASSGSYSLSFSPGVLSRDDSASPAGSAIRFAAPSPMSNTTAIEFDLARTGATRLQIFDVRGALVRTLAQSVLPAGPHHRTWDGRDAAGRTCASGVYFARLAAVDCESIHRLVKIE